MDGKCIDSLLGFIARTIDLPIGHVFVTHRGVRARAPACIAGVPTVPEPLITVAPACSNAMYAPSPASAPIASTRTYRPSSSATESRETSGPIGRSSRLRVFKASCSTLIEALRHAGRLDRRRPERSEVEQQLNISSKILDDEVEFTSRFELFRTPAHDGGQRFRDKRFDRSCEDRCKTGELKRIETSLAGFNLRERRPRKTDLFGQRALREASGLTCGHDAVNLTPAFKRTERAHLCARISTTMRSLPSLTVRRTSSQRDRKTSPQTRSPQCFGLRPLLINT